MSNNTNENTVVTSQNITKKKSELVEEKINEARLVIDPICFTLLILRLF